MSYKIHYYTTAMYNPLNLSSFGVFPCYTLMMHIITTNLLILTAKDNFYAWPSAL